MGDYYGIENPHEIEAFAQRCADEHLPAYVRGWDLARGIRPGSNKVCRACGVDKLYWRESGGRWVLCDGRTGFMHECPVKPLVATNPK